MKIIKQSNLLSIDSLIKEKEALLKKQRYVLLSTDDHLEHIATYVAWKSVGGNIFILNANLPDGHKTKLLEKIDNTNLNNNVVFHTSGSTGVPKLVLHEEQQLNQAKIASERALGWNADTKWFNAVPASTSGFWHLVIPAFYSNNATIVLSSLQTLVDDFNKEDVNETIFVPGLIDMLKAKNISLDLSKLNRLTCGASQVLKRHAEYAFNNGVKIFNHAYGATEICAPMLHRYAYDIDDHTEYMSLTPVCDNEYRIKNDELQVRGASVCSNYRDFDTDDEWYRTKDLWEVNGDLIRFMGRSNDVIKINGCQCSLLEIENLFESDATTGECLAVPKQTRGIEWIELHHTGNISDKIKQDAQALLPKHSIPKKFVKIDSISKTNLGKKIRSSINV